ncbi:DUF4174 domain-containing protein, partial [Algoriphagus sp.]|uniref:DUF4174 domain-containing protein n=1 Tax=Algoriphagus sp. TaxID=1872435 RepID=UPI0025FCCB1A
LKKHEKGLEERRLVIYQVKSGQIKQGLDHEDIWKKTDESFRKIQKKDTQFEVILLGLDGGVKLRKNELLTSEALFRTIDQMPMRRSEIKTKKDNRYL